MPLYFLFLFNKTNTNKKKHTHIQTTQTEKWKPKFINKRQRRLLKKKSSNKATWDKKSTEILLSMCVLANNSRAWYLSFIHTQWNSVRESYFFFFLANKYQLQIASYLEVGTHVCFHLSVLGPHVTSTSLLCDATVSVSSHIYQSCCVWKIVSVEFFLILTLTTFLPPILYRSLSSEGWG